MLDQPFELTINATAFKARCLGLMDDLSRGRLRRVFVTKHGKVVSEMSAPVPVTHVSTFVDDGQYPSYWGCMKGELGLPHNYDWDNFPGVDAPDVEDMSRNLAEQLAQRN